MNNQKLKKIAITTGDVNGIGAEIALKAIEKLELPIENFVLISNSDVLNYYLKKSSESFTSEKKYPIIEIPFDKSKITPGKLTKESGEFSFQSLKKACEFAIAGEISAIVTAPVSKEALHLAGYNFNGQTEVLQYFLAHGNQKAEMLFSTGDFRVLLLTRHIPLKKISLKEKEIVDQILNLNDFFKTKLNIEKPNFGLCALNPHAGEGGILGVEEQLIMQPAVDFLRENGVRITSPLPADTLFIDAVQNYLKDERPPYDCYISPYHDQGLIAIKSIALEKTVNMTIGLDVIRTSPSHGTAFDIAGKAVADANSMIEAIKAALI